MLQFNRLGLLVPANDISISYVTFKNEFTVNVTSHRRTNLFNKYEIYCNELRDVCEGSELHQWIDGSFVTKELNPNDIDLVTFVDFSLIEKLGDKINDFIYPNSKKTYGVDAYIVVVYPDGHKEFRINLLENAYWKDLFSKTKPTKNRKSHAKGFVAIIF